MSLNQLSLMAAAMASVGSVPVYIDTTKHKPVPSHPIVGRDMGKGKKRQPRNELCECGSGKKAKNCCIYHLTSKLE